MAAEAATVVLDHVSLGPGCKLHGCRVQSTMHFRGIPYGTVPRRFALPQPITELPKTLDCSSYGPRCPQVDVDVGHLLRLPDDFVAPTEPEDEFKCLNLDVVVPEESLPTAHGGPSRAGVPVLIWIHGGSQAMTFGSAASKVCDMTRIVQDSATAGQPIIAVAMQYRLNVFAHGADGGTSGPKNLALRDQALAIEWAREHIRGFGGDPENMTLAGESAGAVYCHAHLVSGAKVKQAILSSGSLYLSPPQPRAKVDAFRKVVQRCLDELHGGDGESDEDLETAPVDKMREALRRSGIQSWFLEQEPALEKWADTAPTGPAAKRLLVGDVQSEAVIWRNGIWSADPDSIVKAFDSALDKSAELKRLYGIRADRPASCKIGALDFINDYKFALPVARMCAQSRNEKIPVFRYVCDEVNPWQPSNGAHHAIDLVLLFGGFDLSFSPAAERTGQMMRRSWIRFINGDDPWDGGAVGAAAATAAFGPFGGFSELDDAALGARRRLAHLEFLESVDTGSLDGVFAGLAVGRISLLN